MDTGNRSTSCDVCRRWLDRAHQVVDTREPRSHHYFPCQLGEALRCCRRTSCQACRRPWARRPSTTTRAPQRAELARRGQCKRCRQTTPSTDWFCCWFCWECCSRLSSPLFTSHSSARITIYVLEHTAVAWGVLATRSVKRILLPLLLPLDKLSSVRASLAQADAPVKPWCNTGDSSLAYGSH